MTVSLRKPPGRGKVYACPHCGTIALLSCYHESTGSVRTKAMAANRAAWLRKHGPEKPDRMIFVCNRCGHEGPYEVGMTVGPGETYCARCSGRTEIQITIARRQVAT